MPDTPTPDHFLRAIAAQAARRPAGEALQYDDRSVTWGAMMAAVASRAQALRAQGILPGQRVGLVLRDFIDDTVFKLAVMSLGAAAGTLDLFARPASRADAVARYGLDHVIEDAAGFSGLPQSIRADAAWIARADAIPATLTFDRSPDGHAVIIFSSGTTSAPVGALIGHDSLAAMSRATPEISRRPGTRRLTTYWHSTAAGAKLTLFGLSVGATTRMHPAFGDFAGLARVLREDRIDYAAMSPATAAGLIGIARRAGELPFLPFLPSLVRLSISGAVCPPAVFDQAVAMLTPHAEILYAIGSFGQVAVLTGADLPAKRGSVGRIRPGIKVEIVDDADQPQPTGTEGRLRLRSATPPPVLIGERDDRAGDHRTDGWFYPGDIARLDADGFLFILGREGEVINLDGIKIYAPEVEQALAPCPGLREVAVVAMPDPTLGQIPVAFAVTDPGVTMAELETFARVHLATTKRPHRWVLVRALPRGASDKVLKRDLLAGLDAAS